MNKVKPLLFTTKNSHYLFDDTTQIILSLTKEEYEFIKVCDESSFNDININSNIPNIYHMMNLYSMFEYKKIEALFNKDNIYHLLNRHGIKSLILTVHDECNMRCKYCYFSDKYNYTPSYSNTTMTAEIAQQSVDFYMKHNEKSILSNPNLKYVIGFYGGEPLLNWKVIQNTIDYCKKKYYQYFDKMIFPITTNALLLDNEKIKYMLENNFLISVSFDGTETEHNRNRVDIQGNPTFQRVYKSLENLNYEYQKINKNKVSNANYNILITYDNKTDLIKLNNFFNSNKWLDERIFHINRVSPINTTYYDNQQTETDREYFYKLQNKIIDTFKKTKRENRTKFLNIYVKQMFLFLLSRNNYPISPLRGSCIPGEGKLHIDPCGVFHACERINRYYPLGNLNTGFNTANQYKIIQMYEDALKNTCRDCNLKNICTMCYAIIQNDGNSFEINKKMCEGTRINIIRMLQIYYSLLEENINIMED